MDTLKVNEIFYSVQGEGPLLGTPSLFIRMQGCNLKCEWCDSKYTWKGDHMSLTHELLADHLISRYDWIKHYVFTGGEPLLQEDGLYDVIGRLPDKHITFETNGTIEPHPDLFDRVDLWVVSPKQAQSTFVFDNTEEKVVYKFVIGSILDLAWVKRFISDFELLPNRVWLMPQAIDNEMMKHRLKLLMPFALSNGYNVTPRLQILIWGNVRGV